MAQALSEALEERPRTTSGKSKKKRKKDEEDEYKPEDEPDYGRSGFSRKNRPAAGQIDFCAECNCRFTVTVYNKATEQGLLCSTCGSAEGSEKPLVRAKPRPAVKKRRAKNLLDGEMDKLPSLQDLLIKCIASHIQDVEVLGDIGHVNMDKICQIISRNRSLTNNTVQLFLDASLTTLSLYDCAKLEPQRLTQVAQMCPRLTELRLHSVGQINDDVLSFYATHLTQLTSLALRGCFLVTLSAWAQFFETVGSRMTRLEVTDSARFKAETVDSLVNHCPNVQELILVRLTHLDDAGIAHLGRLQHLTKLDIHDAGGPVTDEAVIALLATVGKNLTSLNISGLRELKDDVLLEGILKYCTNLRHLALNELELLTDQGVCTFFQSWSENPPLVSIELERCPLLSDEALDAIISHSGVSLKSLNLNSLDELTHEGILRITQTNALPVCESLDVSWIRAMDDTVLRRLLENAKALRKLLVWGNNRITECEVSLKCLIVGREML